MHKLDSVLRLWGVWDTAAGFRGPGERVKTQSQICRLGGLEANVGGDNLWVKTWV